MTDGPEFTSDEGLCECGSLKRFIDDFCRVCAAKKASEKLKSGGGPAFPSPTGNPSQHGQLSVRDYFAGQALAGLLANPNVVQANALTAWGLANCDYYTLGVCCYEHADAMLEAMRHKFAKAEGR